MFPGYSKISDSKSISYSILESDVFMEGTYALTPTLSQVREREFFNRLKFNNLSTLIRGGSS